MNYLQCKKCEYSFETEKIPTRCPYCSEQGSIAPYKTAQDFLDED